MDKVVIKKSNINKKGVFANRNFNKGEIVIFWNPKIISKDEFSALNKKEQHYIVKRFGKYLLMQSPEKFVNHSCKPNTKVMKNCDVAILDIKKGEEITSYYSKDDSTDNFQCNCGNKDCRGII